MADTAAPNTADQKPVPTEFTFSRKGNDQTYTAVQFAEKIVRLGTRGEAKGEIIETRDVSRFLAMSEAEIDALLEEYEVDPKEAKLYGANKILKNRAAGGGMADVIMSWLRRDKIAFPNAKDAKQLAKDMRQVAATVLNTYNAKTKQGKTTTIEKCYDQVVN
jgi:hypothetical protein